MRYTFTLLESAQANIRLASDDANTYLYLVAGIDDASVVLHENDDIDSDPTNGVEPNTNSQIEVELSAGDYTIEATTLDETAAGDFTLMVEISEPTAFQQPEGVPGYNIEDAACRAEDIDDAEGFTLHTSGPHFYEEDEVGYRGIATTYKSIWIDSDSEIRGVDEIPGDATESIECIVYQYNDINNARWEGLNYPNVLQWSGANYPVESNEQVFIRPLGDDFLSYNLRTRYDKDTSQTITAVRMLDADALTVIMVALSLYDSSQYPDIEQLEGIAKRIAARIFPFSDDDDDDDEAE